MDPKRKKLVLQYIITITKGKRGDFIYASKLVLFIYASKLVLFS